MLKFGVRTEGLEAIKDRLAEACTKAEHTVALQVRKDTSPYVPALTGVLDQRTRVDGGNIPRALCPLSLPWEAHG